MAIELGELLILEEDFDITLTGFELPEIDLTLDLDNEDTESTRGLVLQVCQKGDLCLLGEHILYIGDSLFEDSYQKLLGDELVDIIFTYSIH